MNDYEQKDMDGVCFEVEKEKLTEDWMAPWSGKGMIEGKMYYINMYDNVSKGGKLYRKLKFKVMPDAQMRSEAAHTKASQVHKSNADDIPW